jgi:hypothetical protein
MLSTVHRRHATGGGSGNQAVEQDAGRASKGMR